MKVASLAPLGFPEYEIREDGTPVSHKSGSPVAVAVSEKEPGGHLRFAVCDGKKRRNIYVHFALLFLFGPPRPSSKHECRHLDGNPANNALGNLAWGTKKDNADDRRAHGRNPTGEKHGRAKLSEPQAREVLSLKGSLSQEACARRFKVSRRAVRMIWDGVNWSHLTQRKPDADDVTGRVS